MTPEGKIKKEISALLKSYEHVFYDMAVPYGYGKSTIDYTGCAGGLYFAIEAKAFDKVPTVRQEIILANIERAAGRTFVINGHGIEWNRLVAFLEDTRKLSSLDRTIQC